MHYYLSYRVSGQVFGNGRVPIIFSSLEFVIAKTYCCAFPFITVSHVTRPMEEVNEIVVVKLSLNFIQLIIVTDSMYSIFLLH